MAQERKKVCIECERVAEAVRLTTHIIGGLENLPKESVAARLEVIRHNSTQRRSGERELILGVVDRAWICGRPDLEPDICFYASLVVFKGHRQKYYVIPSYGNGPSDMHRSSKEGLACLCEDGQVRPRRRYPCRTPLVSQASSRRRPGIRGTPASKRWIRASRWEGFNPVRQRLKNKKRTESIRRGQKRARGVQTQLHCTRARK